MATEENTCRDCGESKKNNYSRCQTCLDKRWADNYSEWMDYN